MILSFASEFHLSSFPLSIFWLIFCSALYIPLLSNAWFSIRQFISGFITPTQCAISANFEFGEVNNLSTESFNLVSKWFSFISISICLFCVMARFWLLRFECDLYLFIDITLSLPSISSSLPLLSVETIIFVSLSMFLSILAYSFWHFFLKKLL